MGVVENSCEGRAVNASELLRQAREAYAQADLTYRDRILEVGRLLHGFVLAHVSQGDGLNERERLEKKFTRRDATKIAASELSITQAKVSLLIQMAMAVELLGDGNPGVLGSWALQRFAPFVQRKTEAMGRRSGGFNRAAGPTSSDAECWTLRDEFADTARRLFEQARRGELSRAEIEEQTRMVHDPHPKRQSLKRDKEYQSFMEQLVAQVEGASPGDVAELCMEIVNASEEPHLVAAKLAALLRDVPAPRRRHLLAV